MVASISTSFIFIAKQYSVLCVYHILFTHSSVYGHVGGFHSLAIMNSTRNIYMQAFVWTYVFISFVFTPRGGLLGYMITLVLPSKELPACFPQMPQHFAFLPAVYQGSSFPHPHKGLLFSYFLMIVILVNVKWYDFLLHFHECF